MNELRPVYRGSPRSLVGRAGFGSQFGAGKDLDIRIPVRIHQAGITITRAAFHVKRNLSDLDTAAVVIKVVDSALTASGQVTDNGTGDGRGEILFLLTAAQTALLSTPHFYSIDVILSNGDAQEVESGIALFPRVGSSSPGGAVAVDHITVTPSSGTAILGVTVQYTAVAYDAANVVLSGVSVVWSTSDRSIATVSQTGLVTAVGEGVVTVSAQAEGVLGTAQFTAAVDDVAALIASTGGDALWPGFYDLRSHRLMSGTALIGLDDARCSTVTGRLFLYRDGSFIQSSSTGFLNSASKATAIHFFQQAAYGGGYIWDVGGIFGYQDGHEGAAPGKVYIGIGPAVVANADFTPPGMTFGAEIKLSVVYDGTLTGDINRLKVFWSWYDKVTGTWSAEVQATLTFTVAVPATISSALAVKIGAGASGTESGAFVDEVRAWNGVALTSAQVAQEVLAATPNAAHLRYSFNGVGTNSGTTAGWTLSGAGERYCSDDLRWGDPWLGDQIATSPVGVSGSATFDGVDDLLYMFGSALKKLNTGEHAILMAMTMPVLPAAAIKHIAQMGVYGGALALVTRCEATTHHPLCYSDGVGLAQGVYVSGRRALHFRRKRSGANVDTGTRVGSTAEVTGTVVNGTDTIPSHCKLGAAAFGATPGNSVVYAIGFFKGDWTAARQTEFNNWAVTRHAVTL